MVPLVIGFYSAGVTRTNTAMLLQLLVLVLMNTTNTALAQRQDLNYSAITGWYSGCNTSTDNQCLGQPYLPLAEPVYLDLDTCYVNPVSTYSSVTYYKRLKLSSGEKGTTIVEFNVIFTNEAFARMPTNCDERGVCGSCGDDFGAIQQELGGGSCNNLISFTYQCRSQVVSTEDETLVPTSCYVPHTATYPRRGELTTACSMTASIASLPPGSQIELNQTSAAPSVPATTVLAPGDLLETLEPSVAPSSVAVAPDTITESPSLILKDIWDRPTMPPSKPPTIRPTIVRVVTPTNAPVVVVSSNEQDEGNAFKASPGLIAAATLIGLATMCLALWGGRPKGGYFAAIRHSSFCGGFVSFFSSCWCRRVCCTCGPRRRDTADAYKYRKSTADSKLSDKVWAYPNSHFGNSKSEDSNESGGEKYQPYNFAFITTESPTPASDSVASVSLASQTQASSQAAVLPQFRFPKLMGGMKTANTSDRKMIHGSSSPTTSPSSNRYQTMINYEEV